MAMLGAWRQWSETEARDALARFERSGETELAFARRTGISRQRLRYWRTRLAKTAKPAFVAVAMPTAAPKIEIGVGEVVLRVREDLDATRLAEIVDALSRVRSC